MTTDVWGQDAEAALLAASECEQVTMVSDPQSGLEAVIAIHSTALGPALGGMRFCAYPTKAAALADALHLAKGMTYKAAVSGLDFGGGKAVVIGDPGKLRSERLLRAYGRFVDALGGRYITAEDVGTTVDDMAVIRRETDFVVGLPPALGGLGDPSPSTAVGVSLAMEAAVAFVDGAASLNGRRVCVVGVGKVGRPLVELLVDAGADVIVADVNDSATRPLVERLGVRSISPDDALTAEVDVLAPCALGGVFTPDVISRLRCKIITGSANNQLGSAACAYHLKERGIVYVPDFVANAGGLVHVAHEVSARSLADVHTALAGLKDRVGAVLRAAEERGVATNRAAEELAEQRIAEIAGLRLLRSRRRG